MRGTHRGNFRAGSSTGIIPAHAGNTDCPMRLLCGRWDHPRACGEHHSSRRILGYMLGSSPRMRGTQDRSVHNLADVGIIPAHAGNTRRGKCHRAVVRDHPRACGEHMPVGWKLAVSLGSSPRMRGTHWPDDIIMTREGIIPAHAGNTKVTAKASAFGTGSSPRMRGTRRGGPGRRRPAGIIPAHAGNTS